MGATALCGWRGSSLSAWVGIHFPPLHWHLNELWQFCLQSLYCIPLKVVLPSFSGFPLFDQDQPALRALEEVIAKEARTHADTREKLIKQPENVLAAILQRGYWNNDRADSRHRGSLNIPSAPGALSPQERA